MADLSLKLILLLLPGIISTKIYYHLTVERENSQFKFLIDSILFGVISYLILQLIYVIYCFAISHIFFIELKTDYYLEIWNTVSDTKTRIPFLEVFFACIISIFVAFISGIISTNRILINVGNKINATRSYGSESLFMYFLDMDNVDEVHVRDINKKLIYHGFVKNFNDTGSEKEIVLIEVDVYDEENTSKILYKIPILYFNFKDGTIHIEVPLKKEST